MLKAVFRVSPKLLCRKVTRDIDGWPTDSQISHKCHRRKCCRPDHLVYELRVCNVRRNYCGIMSKLCEYEAKSPDGTCDCGMVPQCVRMYHPETFEESIKFCETRNQVAEALRALSDRFPFKLLDKKLVRAEALKAENSRKRKARGAAHEAAGRKNLKRVESKLDE
jgi:hypothetical protein